MLRIIKNIFHFISAFLAAAYYKFPGKKLIIIGVTGTDGKTTTAHMLYEILKTAGKKVSIISTIEAVISGESIDTGFHVTTPSPWGLQKLIQKALKTGSEYLVLEITSHGLDQHRVLCTFIDFAVITNISHEHLDYHGTFENYKKAKAKILKKTNYAILNKDDKNFSYLKKQASSKIKTFSLNKKADFTKDTFDLKLKVKGDFNLYNALAAASAASLLGINKRYISMGIYRFSGIKGRMEKVKNRKGFKIYIDFAHKPNALREALKSARKMKKNKLIAVFGSAGLRDKKKRSMMGEIAAQYAEYIILTAEDPRTEDVRDIINEIAKGCLNKGHIEADKRNKDLSKLYKTKRYFWKIPDRQEAVNFAIRILAKKGDLVMICGKGHEQSMCYGKTEFPWDEKQAIEKALYGSIKTSNKI